MQKVIRRTLLAERQAARRLEKRRDKYNFNEGKTDREQQRFVQRDVVGDIKTARRVRREDYELGPLAPRRDVGLKAETYGTIHQNRLKGFNLTKDERMKVNPSGGTNANIVVGDRVVLLKGRDQGKIGKVDTWDARKQEVTVEGLNMVDIAVPEWMKKADQDQRSVRSMASAISIRDVRLVFPLKNPETGEVRDVIVQAIENTKVFYDRYTGKKSWSRKIAGTNTIIPFPKKTPIEHKDNEVDTLRQRVEAVTFLPSLLKPPMPSSVMDELRNKYSIFRTRHDEEYIEAKIKEDEERIAKEKQIKQMRTPLNEINRRERTARRAKGKGKLTPEMLARIGEVIAKKNQAILGAQPATTEAVVA